MTGIRRIRNRAVYAETIIAIPALISNAVMKNAIESGITKDDDDNKKSGTGIASIKAANDEIKSDHV
jgi:hypothetical protein